MYALNENGEGMSGVEIIFETAAQRLSVPKQKWMFQKCLGGVAGKKVPVPPRCFFP